LWEPTYVVRRVVEGLYEHLVTDQLARDLQASGAEHVVAALDDADAPITLARHVGREIERVLESLPREARAEHAREIAGKLIDHLSSLVDGELAASIREQRPPPPPSRLLAVHRGAV